LKFEYKDKYQKDMLTFSITICYAIM